MPHMEPRAGGIGKLHQREVLGLGVVVRGLKGVGVVPALLPLFFNVGVLVFHGYIHPFDAAGSPRPLSPSVP